MDNDPIEESQSGEPLSAEKAKQFTELLTAHHGRVFGCICAIVLNASDAEDLYQQTALVLWKKFDQFELGTDFESWALRVARLTAFNFIRSKRRSRVFFSEPLLEKILDTDIGMESQAALDRSSALQACLKRLSADDNRLVARCYDGQKKIKDVAADEGRTTNAIYQALSRIRVTLFRCMEHRLGMEINR